MPIRSVVSASALAAVVATLVAVGPVSAETSLAVVPAVLDVAGPLGGTGAIEIRVENRGTDETTLASSVEELSTATGLPSATTWSVVRPRKLELEPGEAGTFHLDLDIPNQTDPGGHYTAVSIATTAAKEDGAQAGVSGRIVVPVLITVTGDALRPTPPALPVVDRSAVFLQTDGEYVTRTEIRNDGQTHVALAGDIDIARVAANGARQPMMSSAVSIGRVLPQRVRDFVANDGASLAPDQAYEATIRLASPVLGRRSEQQPGFTETVRFMTTPRVELERPTVCTTQNADLRASVALANDGSIGVAPGTSFRIDSLDGVPQSISSPIAQVLAWPDETTVLSSTMRPLSAEGAYELVAEITVGDRILRTTGTIQTGEDGIVPACQPATN